MSKGKVARTPAGDALFDVIVETSRVFFRLRAAGKKIGAVTAWGGGSWGIMRSLRLEGAQTVPQLARSRPVSRQRIQTLADELAEAGLVAFVDNPAHKRSKLVSLTKAGETACDALTERVMDAANELARDMDETELRAAAKVLHALRAKLAEI